MALTDVLVVGGGGREHALAWALARSPDVGRVLCAPGNGGTATTPRVENVPVRAEDLDGLVALARERRVGLVVVGPEDALCAGLSDRLSAAGIPCFGPSGAAARLEGSKVFSKAFMDRHAIPTARWKRFTDPDAARAFLAAAPWPVVVKASGLCAGKGVIVPDGADEATQAIHEIMEDRAFGAAGDEVVIEERLNGVEASFLAFSDGARIAMMPAARDHKRALDGDRGPNTGGMGAVCPSPQQALADEVARTVLQPAIDALRAEGMPYVGVLYAGIMLTPSGLKVLEFNCRFGDPETQVVLPLLESDLLHLMLDCTAGRLDPAGVRWQRGAAACVVAASAGYPGPYPTGRPIEGADGDGLVFHAGTRRQGDALVTSGGRVLASVGLADTVDRAVTAAYDRMGRIRFEGMHYRRDIGR